MEVVQECLKVYVYMRSSLQRHFNGGKLEIAHKISTIHCEMQYNLRVTAENYIYVSIVT
jgi:hypothetical protein